MQGELTEVELAVDFLTVDDIEPIRDACLHIGHFKVEPLMVVVCVNIRVQDKVIFVPSHLEKLCRPLRTHDIIMPALFTSLVRVLFVHISLQFQ